MIVYIKKNDVMEILHECIVFPEIDESDKALINYELAKIKIMQLPELWINDEREK